MKIFLDLELKRVQIIDAIGFDELEELKKFLGDDYKEWKIEPTADAPAQSQPITFPQTQPIIPGTFPFTPVQPYNPFPTITYGPGTNAIPVGIGGFGITTGHSSTSIGVISAFSGSGTYTTSAGNLSVFSHLTDENKILVAGDFSNATLDQIKEKISEEA